MSADVERLFWSAGLTLSDRRNRMGTKLFEALECLKSWLKIKGFDLDGVDDQGIASRQGSSDSDSEVIILRAAMATARLITGAVVQGA